MGPKKPRSTVLSLEEAAAIITFQKHILLPIDDCWRISFPFNSIHIFDRICKENKIKHRLTKGLLSLDKWASRKNEPSPQRSDN